MELSFVLWNTQRKALYKEVVDLVTEQQADFLIVIENEADPNQLVSQLSFATGKQFYFHKNINFKNGNLYSTTFTNNINTLFEHRRYCIKEVKVNNNLFNLCIVHLPSKDNWGNQDDHNSMCVQLIADINFVEKQNKHKRSIVVGDFNMNPFEIGIINATGLHAVMNRDIAKTGNREIFDKKYEFLYNPMWSFFGDFGRGNVNGTHYYNTSKYVSHFWNMYDQVLIRPDLLENFDDNKLFIIEKIKGVSLTKVRKATNRIDDSISDHLPLTFTLNFE